MKVLVAPIVRAINSSWKKRRNPFRRMTLQIILNWKRFGTPSIRKFNMSATIPVILCIDDIPSRYGLLAKYLAPEVVILVTQSLEDVVFYLNTSVYDIKGVCLDCDLPHGPQGYYYASTFFNERNIPVVIASHNPSEARKCHDTLDEYATPNLLLRAEGDMNWVLRAVDFFKSHGLETSR